ncbi:MAG: DUF5667 domain-containing protein [Nitrososphaerota archaeon]
MRADEQSEDWVDRLDDLLSRRALPSETDRWLLELVRDAEAFPPFQAQADVQPSPAFTDALEARLMDEVGRLHGAPAATQTASTLSVSAAPELRNARMVVIRAEKKPAEPSAAQGSTGSQKARRRRALWWAAVAAAVLMLLGTPLALAAQATPGSPLYAVRRLEQNVQVQLAASPADRASVRLDFARQTLTALETIINQRDYTHYSVDLAEFQDAFQNADAAVSAVPSGSDRTALEASLTTLRTRASDDLRQALAYVNWPDRLKTTAVMGKLQNTVPVIRQVNLVRGSAPGGRGPVGSGVAGNGLTIRIHGNWFALGAVVYINGQPQGEVTHVSPNEVQVLLPGISSLAAGTAVGVSNPDGTAAQITLARDLGASTQGTPVSTPNPHSDSRGSNG